jgi:hypothetical protein
LRGKIVEETYLGSRMQYSIDIGGSIVKIETLDKLEASSLLLSFPEKGVLCSRLLESRSGSKGDDFDRRPDHYLRLGGGCSFERGPSTRGLGRSWRSRCLNFMF